VPSYAESEKCAECTEIAEYAEIEKCTEYAEYT
jgi:hypothetical protein